MAKTIDISSPDQTTESADQNTDIPEVYVFDSISTTTAETASQSLQSIIQFHFQRTIEKKRAIDAQKKELWKLFSCFFIFLSITSAGVANSTRLKCRHSWAPIALCLLAHLLLYASVAQTLRCLNGLKFQRHCHKLTLGLASAKYKRLRSMNLLNVAPQEIEVPYQEPRASYHAKFMKRWLAYTLFLLVTLATTVASFVTILCF